ncbi:ATP-dependent nuclease subunit A, partial [Staphylococcus epidermidis]
DSLTLPKFLQTTQAPTGAEIGSATHLVLEQLDIHKPVTTEAVQATIADLVAKQVLTSAIGDQIQIEPILSFYDSTL